MRGARSMSAALSAARRADRWRYRLRRRRKPARRRRCRRSNPSVHRTRRAASTASGTDPADDRRTDRDADVGGSAAAVMRRIEGDIGPRQDRAESLEVAGKRQEENGASAGGKTTRDRRSRNNAVQVALSRSANNTTWACRSYSRIPATSPSMSGWILCSFIGHTYKRPLAGKPSSSRENARPSGGYGRKIIGSSSSSTSRSQY